MVTPHDRPSATFRLRDLLGRSRVLPVLTVRDPGEAVALVGALAQGGLATVEITLRSDAALAAISAVVDELPEVTVGAGTVTRADQLAAAEQAGASFAVSPGLTDGLIGAAKRSQLALLPGVSTVSEAMVARDAGFGVLKLFPARSLGGTEFLAAVRGPLPELLFCPTGGIDEGSYRNYLAQPNVLCVGGSWMVPPEALAAGDWGAITRRAARLAA